MQQGAAPTPPQAKLMQTADATWLSPVAAPQAPVERMVPANGEEASTINRVRQLEEEIARLRNEMSMMLPAMTKLAETQGALRDVLATTQTAAQAAQVAPAAGPAAGYAAGYYETEPASPAALPPPVLYSQAAAAPAPLAPPPPAAAPVAVPAAYAPAGPGIGAIRFGQNNGRTRVVLDAPYPPDFSYALDESARVLTVSLPGSGWAAAAADAVAGSPLVASYSAAPDGQGGTTLTLQLRAAAQVAMAQSLPPAAPGKGHRVVLDIAPL
jgi:hypothetical protein